MSQPAHRREADEVESQPPKAIKAATRTCMEVGVGKGHLGESFSGAVVGMLVEGWGWGEGLSQLGESFFCRAVVDMESTNL